MLNSLTNYTSSIASKLGFSKWAQDCLWALWLLLNNFKMILVGLPLSSMAFAKQFHNSISSYNLNFKFRHLYIHEECFFSRNRDFQIIKTILRLALGIYACTLQIVPNSFALACRIGMAMGTCECQHLVGPKFTCLATCIIGGNNSSIHDIISVVHKATNQKSPQPYNGVTHSFCLRRLQFIALM